jgi:hypothetical protein
MDSVLSLESVCCPSEDIVARIIEDDLVIVPLAAGIGDMENELYSLNETGRAIWDRLDGSKKISEVVHELAEEFEATDGEIQEDVLGLLKELVKRKIVVVCK